MKLYRYCSAVVAIFLTAFSFILHASPADIDTLATIQGIVLEGKEPLRGATVKIVTEKESQLDSAFRVTTRDGLFSFRNIRPGKAYVRVSHIGYNAEEGIYDLSPGENVIYFTLGKSTEKIKEAKIVAKVPLVKVLQDTTIYNAAAVNTQEGESALEIIKQLPGFAVGDKGITIEGRKVARTYVNGVQIFGNNATTAFHSLRADEVSQIRVYDELSPEDRRLGLKLSRKERVLDIKTKDPIASLGQVTASLGGGADGAADMDGNPQGRYAGLAGVSFDSEMLNFTVSANADNVKYIKLDGETEFFDLLASATSYSESLNSYFENLSAVVKLDKYWKDRYYGPSLYASYFFDKTYRRSAQQAITDYFGNEENPEMSYTDSTSTASTGRMHSLRLSAKLNNTRLKNFSFDISGDIADNRNSASEAVTNRITGRDDIRQMQHSGVGANDYRASANISWSSDDNIKLLPYIRISADYSHNNSLSWNLDTLESSFTRRQLESDQIGNGYKIGAEAGINSYLVNNDRHSLSIGASYIFKYDNIARKQMTYDLFGNEEPVIDPTNTYDYTWNTRSNELSCKLQYNIPKVKMNFGFNIGRMTQMDEEKYPKDDSFDRSYNYITPALSFHFFNQFVDFSSSSSQPSLEQSRDRIDDSNPMMLIAGNPSLKQTYTSRAIVGGRIWKSKKMTTTLTYKASFTYLANTIVSKTTYFTEDTHINEYGGYDIKSGSQMLSFENADGDWSSSVAANLQSRFPKARINISVTPSFDIEKSPQYIGSELSCLMTQKASARLIFNWSPRKFRFTLHFSGGYFDSRNDLSQRLASGCSLTCSAGASYSLPYGMLLSCNASGNSLIYSSGPGRDLNSSTLKCEFTKFFLKRNLEVTFSAMDLLSNSEKYTTSVTSNYYRQSWTPSYGRYFMLTVRYTFRKKN